MKKIIYSLLCLCALVWLFNSCASDDGGEAGNPDSGQDGSLSSNKEILAFNFIVEGEEYIVNYEGNMLTVELPALTDVTELAPEITISDKATIKPEVGVFQDFTNTVTYTVTAEDGTTKDYLVTVSLQDPSASNEIISFSFTNLAEGQASYTTYNRDPTDIDSLVYDVPYLSPLKELTSDIFIPDGATIAPASGETLDYRQPVKYTVTAQNGDQKEYLIFVENDLEEVKIEGFTGDSFIDKKPGDFISFNVNVVNPIQDSVKVSLFDYVAQSKVSLQVQSIENIDFRTNTITAQLPDTYTNSNYRLDVSIEHDNSDESDGFLLDKGIPNFVHVNADFKNPEYVSVENLLSPGNGFDAAIYIEKSRIDMYKFYLKQNGNEYLLDHRGHSAHFPEIYFNMISDLAAQGASTGSNYQFVIEIDGMKYEFPFINDKKEAIEVIPAGPPVITSINKNAVTKGETITISGENLHFETSNYDGTAHVSYLSLRHPSNAWLTFSIAGTSTSSNQITFTIPESVQSETYTISYQNNLGETVSVDPMVQTLTVNQPASEHPTLSITKAVLYLNDAKPLHKQVLVSFSNTIESSTTEDFVLESGAYEVSNYIINPSSVLSGQLSDEKANRVSNFSDGSIVVDGYKMYFTLTVEN
ncbi:DUF5018 domain-containing protein [Aquimarina gracilis]|uniref:DUF5018 domain-containing protein n=1 Tax=Aquimarina gracilis TaxID=874422 RepID=A0ABU5ZWY4_9FLAO|nr:DUF5018 domain-containing protein [Aquimarina gracilis]MEB3346371.1 DUF5018 domain-containing protein [Aquimarina gracilis]